MNIRFGPSYGAWVRVHKWHESQTFTDLTDGSAESTFHVHHLQEMVYFVLRTGGKAQVISPPELRTMVRDTAQEIVADHAA